MGVMSVNEDYLSAFVDYVTLTYHEARNVRHLIKDGHIDPRSYERLANLPRNREDAWRALQAFRSAARKASSARSAEAVFEERLGVGLEDLKVLFENQNWKHSKTGGNRWACITRGVINLRDAMDRQDMKAVPELVGTIRCMRHNTDGIDSKLCELDRCLDRTAS
jgi:hypothetical protein